MTPSTTSTSPRRALLAALASLGLFGAMNGTALAQGAANFPSRPITLMVPFAAGGIADLTARAVAESMGRSLGQAVVVDNRPSAGSIVASQAVAGAAPDGHTLLLMSNGHAVSVGLFKKLPYDPEKDFQPISLLGTFDLGIFAPTQGRFATLADALTYARANPGKLNIGTITPGSTQHLSAKLFETQAGIDAVVVPYKASPAVITALRSGEIDLAFEITGPMVSQVQSGAIKALAVTSDKPEPALPGVQTVMQQGIAGYNVASWNALAAPTGTPAAVVDKLNKAVRDAVASPEVREKLGKIGVKLQASSPAELQQLLHSEIQRWGDVIRRAKIDAQ